jgi:hypothetical protein
MLYLGKPIHDIDKNDLQKLVDEQREEDKHIEYKEALPKNGSDDKKEFAADVSAFANADGGVIIYGIKEKTGLPTELCGIDIANKDDEIRRLDQMIMNNIAPRVLGIEIPPPIDLGEGKVVLIINIPKSFSMPHMVSLGDSRFYLRRSRSRPPLDVEEIRNAFLFSNTITEKIKNFRIERISKIFSNSLPFKLNDGIKLVLQVVPLSAFSSFTKLDIGCLSDKVRANELHPFPILSGGYYSSVTSNIDGFVAHSFENEERTILDGYFQVFRTGIVETLGVLDLEDDKKIGIQFCEREIKFSIERSLQIYKQMGISPPFFIMATLLGAKGATLEMDKRMLAVFGKGKVIDRNEIFLPEIYLEKLDDDLFQVLHPVFDAMWNAAGWAACQHYDEEGNYQYKYEPLYA